MIFSYRPPFSLRTASVFRSGFSLVCVSLPLRTALGCLDSVPTFMKSSSNSSSCATALLRRTGIQLKQKADKQLHCGATCLRRSQSSASPSLVSSYIVALCRLMKFHSPLSTQTAKHLGVRLGKAATAGPERTRGSQCFRKSSQNTAALGGIHGRTRFT